MNSVIDQIAQRSQDLPPEKQVEVLDFIEFLASRQTPIIWTVEERRTVVSMTVGCLAHTHTSSDSFAGRKREEKAKEERRWRP
jgi:Protein of unknown function (DUF2281)